MAKMGIPTLKLKSGFGKGKKAGNAAAVAKEALEERFSSDPDLDRSKTKYNVYLRNGFRSGAELAEYWQREADAFRTVDKNGKEKRLRSDASIGCALIVKPEKAYLDTLPEKDQIRLVKDAMNIVCQECVKRGIQIDAGVLQVDEAAPHGHIFGHDPKYQLGKKMNLAFFRVLNKRVPELMRQKGWDIQDLTVYDLEAVENMTDDEKAAYNEQRRAEREAHGLDAPTYKAKKREEEQNARESAQNVREDDLKAREAKIQQNEQNAIIERSAASQALSEAEEEREAAKRERAEAERLRREAEAMRNAAADLSRVANQRVVQGKPIQLRDGRIVYEAGPTVAEKQEALLKRANAYPDRVISDASPEHDMQFGQ